MGHSLRHANQGWRRAISGLRIMLVPLILAAIAQFASAQDATEQTSINGIQRGLVSRAAVFACEGLIPAWNAATSALGVLDSIGNVGKHGEWIIGRALGVPKNTTNFAGRIPDFVTPTAWVESKKEPAAEICTGR